MLFPTGMNLQEQQNGFQRPYLPDAAGCSHAASPTSASGRGRCQTLGLAWTMEIHLCWRAAAWKAANPLLLTEASTPAKARSFEPHARPYGTVTWESATWVSCHGVAASPFPCLPEPGAGSAGRAGIPQRFRHIPPSPSEQLKGEVTTPALPPLSLARTLQILARLMGKAKAWLLSLFSPSLLCFFLPQSSVRAGDVIF